MTVAIIQARMSSIRLPGKVLMPLGGEPVLWRVIERAQQSKFLDDFVVATSTEKEDDAIQSFCEEHSIHCFRGSRDDVLARYYDAARELNADSVVRITSDCPLIDPHIIDACIERYTSGAFDYVSNCTVGPRTFPRGLDVEVFSFSALERAHQEANAPDEREHVTPYLWRNESLFNLGPNVEASPSLHRPQYRLTLDYSEDYQLLAHVYDALRGNGDIRVDDVVHYLDTHPEVAAMNAHCEQKKV